MGLEIHQQLDTGRKLFCGCRPADVSEYTVEFRRRLRAARGELGRHDAAALFEGSKSAEITYCGNPGSSCDVEYDEEPPHGLDPGARRAALVIASALGSRVFTETYAMRKTVVDGSNTAGFQRTMLVAAGGGFEAGGRTIGVQSVCLEEDAARNLGGAGGARRFGLERLGIPLVEIATEPFEAAPGEVRDIALALGRMLRGTGTARRGLGSIRQDVNVSIRDGRGAVVEVKGVQQLDQLGPVIQYEALRQHGMLQISARLSGWSRGDGAAQDVTGLLSGCGSKIIQKAVKQKHGIFCIALRGLGGVLGFEPHEGVRLGRELADMARTFGLGGLFHSDELPAYGVEQSDVEAIRGEAGLGAGDGFVVLACPRRAAGAIAEQLICRVERIRDEGVPADTRTATADGRTRFLRPRPGAARMYPETDVPPVVITPAELEEAGGAVPKPWDESVGELEGAGLSRQLAEQLLDSRYLGLFESITGGTGVGPSFVASALCSTITSLERDGHDAGLLSDAEIARTFELLDSGRIAKESVGMIFEGIMSGRFGGAEEAASSIGAVGGGELEGIIRGIVERNAGMVRSRGAGAAGPLMGVAMGELRGRASGEEVSRVLSRIISEYS